MNKRTDSASKYDAITTQYYFFINMITKYKTWCSTTCL